MAIPPQLAEVLSDNATAVQEFCNMASGIPWTNQILDDMMESLTAEGMVSMRVDMTPPVNGLTSICGTLLLCEAKVKKPATQNIIARVTFDWHAVDIPEKGQIHEKRFDFDRKGFKDAICFVQQRVQNIKRRGLCDTCLTAERPRKRLRVGDTGLCTKCLLQKAVF